MQVVRVTLLMLGCLLTGSEAHTTSQPATVAPSYTQPPPNPTYSAADNLVSAHFTLQADASNLTDATIQEFTLGAGSTYPTDPYGGAGGGGGGGHTYTDLNAHMNDLMNSIFSPPPGSSVGGGGYTGGSNATDMLLPGLTATDFGNMLAGSGGHGANTSHGHTYYNSTPGAYGPVVDNTVGGGASTYPSNPYPMPGATSPSLPAGGFPTMPSTPPGGGPSASAGLADLLSAFSGGGGSSGPMATSTGLFGAPGSPLGALSAMSQPKPTPAPNRMKKMLQIVALSTAAGGGEMPEGMEMMIPMMLISELVKSGKSSGSETLPGSSPFGGLGGMSNPMSGMMGSNPLSGMMGSNPLSGMMGSNPLSGMMGSNPLGGMMGSNPLGGMMGSNPLSGMMGSNPMSSMMGMMGNPLMGALGGSSTGGSNPLGNMLSMGSMSPLSGLSSLTGSMGTPTSSASSSSSSADVLSLLGLGTGTTGTSSSSTSGMNSMMNSVLGTGTGSGMGSLGGLGSLGALGGMGGTGGMSGMGGMGGLGSLLSMG